MRKTCIIYSKLKKVIFVLTCLEAARLKQVTNMPLTTQRERERIMPE